ncbi:MAG TPA: hypothetical protein ENK93_03140 [Campylobacteraceae bacterium]|nr:hypothetical protein [Campylobacteraceae bacterium]
MMKKLFWSTWLALTALHAGFNPAPYESVLQDLSGQSATVPDRDIPVGSSGIVLHAFDKRHRTIIATAIVTGKKEGKLTLTFRKFDRLRQSALPEYKIAPAKGDVVILNYLYNRILPILPDAAHFRDFATKHQNFEIVHPDLFASALYFDHDPQPTKEDFRKACVQNDLSLLYFAVGRKGRFVDCESFRVIDEEPLATPVDSQKAQKPFYSRVPEIKNRLGGIMGSESIGDYNLYYRTFLELKKPKTEK